MNKVFKSIVCGVVSAVLAGCMILAVGCNDDPPQPDAITYTGATLPAGEVGVDYTGSVATATGAENIRYTMSRGALPAGISLSQAGALSGRPTQDGDYSFTIRAAAGSLSATADFTLKVNKHYYDITYNGGALPVARINTPYETSVATATSAGTAAVTYALQQGSTLPAGLTLSAAGVISGTPTVATDGAVSVSVTASAADAHPATAVFSLTVASGDVASVTYTASDLENAQLGAAYNANVATATGAENITYALYQGSALPAGLTLSEAGVISGTPTGESKTYSFTIEASAAGAISATAQFSLFVKPEKVLREYTFEAENVDLTGVQGTGISGTASGTKLITASPNEASNCSNGYYVGWSHRTGFSISFVIHSDEATTAKLSLSLGTEGSPIPVNDELMTVKVNNRTVSYDTEEIAPQYNQRYVQFNKYEIAASVQLKEGDNTITLTIQANELGNAGSALGFMIDALYLETDAYLSWTPRNLEITNPA